VTDTGEVSGAAGGVGADGKLKVSPLRKIAEITLGIILVIIGLIGGLIPVLQGWMFGIPGLILLAKHFKWAKSILEWAKKKWDGAKAGGPAGGGDD
jgi:sulfite exporter TauE/SafE